MAEASPVTAIHGLAPMTFRGVEAPPYDNASFDFSHGQPERPYPYIDGTGHEHTGFNSENLQFTLYFLNTLGDATIFPDLWDLWWRELQNGSPGELVHPILGPRKVVVQGGSVQLTGKVTSGVIVNVQFSTTLIDPEQEQQFHALRVNITELAAAADRKTKNAEIPFPSGKTEDSLLDLVKKIDGAIFALEMDALGVISEIKSAIDEMVDFVDNVSQSHTDIESRDALVELWVAVDDIAEKAGAKARSTGSILLDRDTTLSQFAQDRSNTVGEVAGLNPAALAAPTVSEGTMLRYYT